jgi:hypothetical protein
MKSRALVLGAAVGAAIAAPAGLRSGGRLLASGALTIDLGVGRSTRPLGPITVRITAPRETVFDVIAEPYLRRTPRALAGKLQVLERGADMALAAHFTPLPAGGTATTVETVRFERPESIHFRLLRGPVPHVVETFALHDIDGETELTYSGEMGADLWALGRAWCRRVAPVWERTVAASLRSIAGEAERRAGRHARGQQSG